MPRVSMFVYSESADPEVTPQGQKLKIINPYATLNPIFVPGAFSFSISLGLQGVEHGIEHALVITFSLNEENSPNIIDTGELRFKTENDPANINIPVQYQGFALSIDCKNVVFRQNGEYVSKVYFNGDLIGQFPIYCHGRELI
ncbi:hypothetical protein [Paenibacillus sp. NPDC058177]|uniref:hypothetical protein n=1 Tax=Paenibacillus sp. NPDC058177 TaxID=3346369 RepID=UPI0036DF764F